ncbi:MAG: helix-turn-helix transcriptional regulator [Firmicutes bacterium]|nr:helix-turn-helix transcriptional regulator [Bacillota bacterium]
MSLSNNFSNNVSVLREIRKLTLTEFANEIQISRSHLQSVLRYSCNPTLDTVEQVAKGLDVDPLTLLSLPKDMEDASVSPPFAQNLQEMKLHLRAALHILEEMLPEDSASEEKE